MEFPVFISVFYMSFVFAFILQALATMAQDVEMKEQQPATTNSISDSSPSTIQHLKDIAALIERGAYTREVRRIITAIRWTIQMRTKLNASVLSEFLNFALVTGSEAHSLVFHDMEVDTEAHTKHALPELEIYCYLLVLIFLIDQKRYNEAKACSSASIARVKNLNRRTIDVLASRLYSYYSLSYELTGDLAEIRGTLLSLHRTATLRHDELGQETLLNLLLRNYLHYNLYDQAEKLRSKAPRFEAHSNQQASHTAKIMYFILIALHYMFNMFDYKAVWVGDLELLKKIADKYTNTFTADRTNNLIVRLRHDVIRTGLGNISISYSRISLTDIAAKLRLDSPSPVADAQCIVSKAIRDGAIDARLNRASGSMVSKETGHSGTSTNKPQAVLNSRIAFCLNMHNEAIRALRFPPNSHKEKESAEKRRERQQQEEQELAKIWSLELMHVFSFALRWCPKDFIVLCIVLGWKNARALQRKISKLEMVLCIVLWWKNALAQA
ncbi:26S proteasome regulatory subunit S3 [Striga asiatica]|uniref:26S proteasome regulatory subunit S3 n=1 Tax=Striga asiatica TaxID=4170 RepID=A0A5A7PPE3_STRAF|nr:26S proteasome regulatory subunit S3 [Striga asiatica]